REAKRWRFQGIRTFSRKLGGKPSIDSPCEGPDSRDSFSLQQQRHPGARRLVGSRAVEDDLAIAGNFLVAAFQLFHPHVKSTGYSIGNGLNIEGMAQVHDHNLLAGG